MRPTARTQALLVAGGQVLGSLVSLATVAWLARLLPPDELGVYLYFVAAAAAVEGLSDLGLRFHGVAGLAATEVPSSRARLLNTLWQLKLLLSTVTILVVVIAAAAGWLQYASLPVAVLLGVVTVTLPSSSPVVWDVRARSLQWLEAALLVAYRMAFLALIAVLASSRLDAPRLLAALLAANVGFAVALAVTRNRLAPMPSASGTEGHWPMLRSAAPLGLSLLAAQVAPRVWVLLLAAVAPSARVAVFSVAVTIVQTVLLVSVAAGAAYLPVLGKLARVSPDEFRMYAGRLLDAMAMIGTLVAIGMALSAAALVPAVFGAAMREAATIVIVLSVLPPVLLVSFTSRIVLSAAVTGRQDLIATLAGLGAGLAGAWLMLDRLGASAVVAGLVISEFTTCTLKLLALGRIGVVSGAGVAHGALRTAPALVIAVTGGLALDGAGSPLLSCLGAALAGMLTYAVMLTFVPSIRARGFKGFLP